MTYPGALKTARIGFGIGYGHMPYTSAVETAGIGTAYASVFKSARIGPFLFLFLNFLFFSNTYFIATVMNHNSYFPIVNTIPH